VSTPTASPSTGGAGTSASAPAAAAGAGAPPASRRATVWFYSLAALGLAGGFALWVHAVVDQPPVKVGELRIQQQDTGARVQTLAHNTSAEVTYCVEIEMQAVDRDGGTLEKVVATSSSGDAIRPGQKANFVGEFSELTPKEISEELDEYVAYVTRREPC
jgi:hypothetical protein